MKNSVIKKWLPLVLAALIPTSFAFAEDVSPIPVVGEGFRFSVTPYLWLTGLNGVFDYKNMAIADTSMNANKILNNLSTGAMLDGEVHYDRWGILGNAIYAKLSNASSKSFLPNQAATVSSQTDAWLGIYTVAGTYSVVAEKDLYVDLLGGARFLNLNSKIQLDASAISYGYNGGLTLYSSTHATDAIAGFKGRVRLSDTSFYFPFYVDAGGGSATAKFTTQESLGIGYAFNYFDLSLVYNNLYYSMSNENKSSYINMSGPLLAATFRF